MIITHTVVSKTKNLPAEAVVSVIAQTKKDYAKNAQAIHIIFASLIETKGRWACVVSVVVEPIRDDDMDAAIIFGHLPRKYADLYDDILPEVDNLNLIDDDSVWQNIKYYLLDVYFYQAVHFKKLERITETGGGYFKEAAQSEDIEADEDLTFEMNPDEGGAPEECHHIFNDNFYSDLQAEKDRLSQSKKQRRQLSYNKIAMRNKSKAFIKTLRSGG